MSPVSATRPVKGNTPTATIAVIDPNGTPTVGSPISTGSIAADSVAAQNRQLSDGIETMEFRSLPGVNEGVLGAWADTVAEAMALTTPTNEVLLKYTADATTVYYPMQAITVVDEPGYVFLTIDGGAVQPAWTVGVTEADSAYAFISNAAGDDGQQNQWGNENTIPAATLELIIVEAETITAEVAQVQDLAVAEAIAAADRKADVRAARRRRSKTQSWGFDVTVDDSVASVDLRQVINDVLNTTDYVPIDWDAGVVGVHITLEGGNVTFLRNGLPQFRVDGSTLAIAAPPDGEEVIDQLEVSVASGDPEVTLDIQLQRRITG